MSPDKKKERSISEYFQKFEAEENGPASSDKNTSVVKNRPNVFKMKNRNLDTGNFPSTSDFFPSSDDNGIIVEVSRSPPLSVIPDESEPPDLKVVRKTPPKATPRKFKFRGSKERDVKTGQSNLLAPKSQQEPKVNQQSVWGFENMKKKNKTSYGSDHEDEENKKQKRKFNIDRSKPLESFRTARTELIQSEARKGREVALGGVSSQVNPAGSYGQSSKLLGGRVSASGAPLNSQFKPPVKQNGRQEATPPPLNRSSSGGVDEATVTSSSATYDKLAKLVEKKLLDIIESEIMVTNSSITWDSISGLDREKAALKEIVVWPFLRPDIFTGIRAPPKGVLLFGPPGTGKTMIGKCVASQCDATFFNISASSMTSKWVGEGEKLVRALFMLAREKLPAVIFIDEIDSLLSSRSESEHESSRRIKTEFLVQMEGLGTQGDERLLVLGATNRPQELDEAARRRFGKRLYISLPDQPSREEMVEKNLVGQRMALSREDVQAIGAMTQGFSGSDMQGLCREAAMNPVREIEDISKARAEDIRGIEYRDFELALKRVRPTVAQSDLKNYEEWNEMYGVVVPEKNS